MGKVIALPHRQTKDSSAKIIQVRMHLIDLAEHRKRLEDVRREVARIKRRLLRLVTDDSSSNTQT